MCAWDLVPAKIDFGHSYDVKRMFRYGSVNGAVFLVGVMRWYPVAVDESDAEYLLIVIRAKGIPAVFRFLIDLIVRPSLSKSLRVRVKIVSIDVLLISVWCSRKSSLNCIDP